LALNWQLDCGDIYDATDLTAWEANFGNVAPLSATSITVSEPATGFMLMLEMVTMLTGRRTAAKKSISS